MEDEPNAEAGIFAAMVSELSESHCLGSLLPGKYIFPCQLKCHDWQVIS